jgi:hypothetical protein
MTVLWLVWKKAKAGWDDVGGDAEALLFAGLFEDLLDGVFCFFGVEGGLALVTTEGDEVELLGAGNVAGPLAWWFEQFTSHPSQSARRMGHAGFVVSSEWKD